jgi:hypothetical protein
MWISFIKKTHKLYIPNHNVYNVDKDIIFMVMKNMEYEMEVIGDGVVRILIGYGGKEVGILYFERVKKSFQRKPISMDGWGCIDAKIDGLYDIDPNITPKDIMMRCQEIIKGTI